MQSARHRGRAIGKDCGEWVYEMLAAALRWMGGDRSIICFEAATFLCSICRDLFIVAFQNVKAVRLSVTIVGKYALRSDAHQHPVGNTMQREKRLKHSLRECRQRLDDLDSQASRAAARQQRRAERIPYRTVVKAAFHQDRAQPLVYTSLTRNLSRFGVALLIGQFIYAGTACCLNFELPDGDCRPLTGKVIRCRYLAGSASLYEIGVEFDSPIYLAESTPSPPEATESPSPSGP